MMDPSVISEQVAITSVRPEVYPVRYNITQKKHIASLEGCRGFALIIVVMFHFPDYFLSHEIIGWGYLGVDFFFILSGFIIARTFEDGIVSGRISFRQFITRRISRLYPAYLCSFLLILGVNCYTVYIRHWGGSIFWGTSDLPMDIASQLLMMQAVFGPPISLIAAAWSLSVEWVLNLLFFALTRLYRLPAFFLYGLVADAVIYLEPRNLNLWVFESEYLNIPLIRGLAGFCVGILVFRYHHRLPAVSRRWLHMSEFLLVSCIAAAGYYHADVSYIVQMDYAFLLVLFPALLLINLYEKSWVCRFFSSAALRGLGQLSYSAYLLHRTVAVICHIIFPQKQLGFPWSGLIYMYLLILFSYLMVLLIEKPCRKIGKRLSS